MTEKEPSLAARLMKIDRRFLFFALFLAVCSAILFPFELPVKPSPLARRVYQRIEALSAEQSPRILVSLDYDPSSKEELHPMAKAFLAHCFSKGIKVVAMTHQPGGVGIAQEVVLEQAKRFGRTYGRDFAYLGYRSGERALIISMTESFPSAFDRDAYGNRISELPVLRGIRNLSDFDYLFVISHGETIEWWIVFGQDKARIPVGGGCTAVVAPDLYPWIQTGQLEGLLGGLAGAAEYEALTGEKGDATAGMRAQSVAHLLIILFVVVGNLAFLREALRGRRYQGGKRA